MYIAFISNYLMSQLKLMYVNIKNLLLEKIIKVGLVINFNKFKDTLSLKYRVMTRDKVTFGPSYTIYL